MKSVKKILIIIVFGLFIIFGLFWYKNFESKKLERVFKTKAYAYLPLKAKEYIEKVYIRTGNILNTEKNKENNEPYLNPKYIEYLELSAKEKEKVDLIPDIYILDYEVNKSYFVSTLPSSYDLRNVDGKNYVSAIKNQGTTEICWAFASIENVETLLMKNKSQSYSDQTQKFSIRQMDYATSTDRFIKSYVGSFISCDPVESCDYYPWKNPDNGSRELGKGGNFFTSSIIMANGLTLVDETILPWNEDEHTYWPKDIFDYDNSLYEVDSTIQMPTINEDSVSAELINSYVNDVKQYMISYGGPFVGTYSPKSTCGFDNIDGKRAIKTDDCVNDALNNNQGHAMQIIGWDDNYEYSYCDAGTKHHAVTNGSCPAGELITGKGAWILKNSWGEAEENYKYVYLTYDSTRLSIGFTTSLSEMSNRSWDNNYHSNPWIESNIVNGMVSVSEQTKEFDTHNDKPEKLEKIKFFTATKHGKFTLSIITEDREYNDIAVVNSNEVGIYTIDLSNENIVLNDNNFSVKLVGENEDKFYNDSLSVFTSNMDDIYSVSTYSNKAYDPAKPLSNFNPLFVHGEDSWDLVVNTYLKNIPSNSDLTYRVQKDGVIATENQIGDFRKTIINDIGDATFKGHYSASSSTFSTSSAYGNTYTFEVLYEDIVVDSFPIKFSGKGKTTKSNIKLYANNGTDKYYETQIKDKTTSTFKFSNINFKEFYNNGYYITSWNTKADGTGISYNVDDILPIYHDFVLYAQWSNEPLNIKFNFKCKSSDNCSGTGDSITVNLNDNIAFPENTFTKDGYKFIVWVIDDKNYRDLKIYEQEKRPVVQLLNKLQSINDKTYFIFNNSAIDVNAYWSNNSKTITFDSNSGVGFMKSINIEPNISYRIKDNLFTKDGYGLTSWNTKADGTGTNYTNSISIEEDLTLYAQWEPITYTIQFNPNGASGTMSNQTFIYDIAQNLTQNTFSRNGFKFSGWNTKKDGTGTAYNDKHDVVNLTSENGGIINLYAQWEEIIKNIINETLDVEVIYDGKEHTIKEKFDVDQYDIRYSIDNSYNLIQAPKFKEVGEYKINYKVNKEGYNELLGSNKVLIYGVRKFNLPIVVKNDIIIVKDGSFTKLKQKVDIFALYHKLRHLRNNVLLENDLIKTGDTFQANINNQKDLNYQIALLGDVDANSKISSGDYVKIKKHIMDMEVISDKVYFYAADTDYNNKISSGDYVKIKNYIMNGGEL